MPAAADAAILRDVFVLAMIALGLAVVAYALMRHYAGHQWHADGNVLSRPYDVGDGLVALLLVSFFGLTFFQQPEALASPEKAQAAVSLSTLVLNSGFFVLICVALLLYMVTIRGLNPAEMFGLRQSTLGRAAWQAVVIVAITYVLVQSLNWLFYTYVLHGTVPENSSQDMVQSFKGSSDLVFRSALGFVAVVVAPLTEEFIFRGYVYGVTKRFTDRWFAALFSAVIFAVVHHDVSATLPLFLLAVGLAAAYEATGCLLVPVIMHAIFNAWNLVILSLA